MGFRVETVILGPETDQYAGKGQSAMSVERIVAASTEAEALGYDGITVPEAGHDPYLPLAIVAEHTERATLGTNVAISFPRSPMVTAQVAWDLQQLAKGRFEIGLGTQVKGHNERRYSAPWTGPPGPRMREYVECMRAIFDSFATDKKPEYRGEHYQFTLMSPFFNPGPIDYPTPRINLAAVNTYMASLAGELCDGLRLHPIATFSFTKEVLLPAIERGARKSGRELASFNLIGAPFLAVAQDEQGVERAKAALKQHIAFYASTRTYHSVLEHHDWLDVGAKLHRLSKEGKWQDLPAAISDEMLEEWAIVGTCEEMVPKLQERCAGLFQTVLLDLKPNLRRETDWIREVIRQLHG